jgi:hypothetical protein
MSHTRRRVMRDLASSAVGWMTSPGDWLALAATPGHGELTGVIGGTPGGRIAISVDGRRVLAYVCNGTEHDDPTFAHWFAGESEDGSATLTENTVTLQIEAKGASAHGILRLPDEAPHPFLADSRLHGKSEVGLYRSEEVFGGETYIGGWIVNPNRRPAASEDGPSIRRIAWPSTPSSERSRQPRSPNLPDEPISDLRELLEDYPRPGGGIIRKKTGDVLPYAPPDLEAMTAYVPGLGTFHLSRCLQARCA